MSERDLSKLTDDQLIDLEESLYDLEVEGFDTWFERDKVLWELNYRKFPKRKSNEDY